MSWYSDPDLVFDFVTGKIRLWRLKKNFGSPRAAHDFTYLGTVENYLSLVDYSFPWKKSDFDALAAFLYRYDLSVNCQGLVSTITFPRDRHRGYSPDTSRAVYFWSHDVVNLPRYGLPVPSVPYRAVGYIDGGFAPMESSHKENELTARLASCINDLDREKSEKQNLEKQISELKLKNASLTNDKNSIILERDEEKDEKKNLKNKVADLEAANATLKEQLHQEKRDKQDFEKKVIDLTSKLEEKGGCGAVSVDKEPWMSNSTVSSAWVCFEDLDVQSFSRSLRRTTLTITKASGSLGIGKDLSTNVESNNFYRVRRIRNGGLVCLIVAVNVADLNPNREKARFDPCIWGLFSYAGTDYAARKLTESEKLVVVRAS